MKRKRCADHRSASSGTCEAALRQVGGKGAGVGECGGGRGMAAFGAARAAREDRDPATARKREGDDRRMESSFSKTQRWVLFSVVARSGS